MAAIFLVAGGVIFAYFNVLFVIALLKRDNSIVDIGWGFGFIIIAWLTFFAFGGGLLRQYIVTALITVWGLRLSIHIYLRNRGKEEDWRYKQWREQWGKWFVPRSYLQVFMLQAVLMLIVGLPIIHINSSNASGVGWTIVAGVVVWLSGFILEAVTDKQLSDHINNPTKKGLLTSGAWSISRHPNYLGETIQWWGIGLLSLASIPSFVFYSNGEGLWALIGPLAITLLVRYVSGVPLLEKKYATRPDFEAYKRTTPVFFPWPQWLRKP